MIKRWHVSIDFKWFDFWVGLFVDRPAKTAYVCLLPTLPIKVWFTNHVRCPDCGDAMNKSAYDTGDGWGLFWECPTCCSGDGPEIDWPFGDQILSYRDLERFGYDIV